MELALEIYTKKKKKTCKFCDEYKRVAVIFKRDTIPIFERVYRDYNFFFNKLFSIPPSKRNNIRHISKLHFSLQFSIDPNCNISSKNILLQRIKEDQKSRNTIIDHDNSHNS